jgi:hypothetical protein
MAITQSMCSSFKQELLGGIHDLDADVIKMALYTSAATLGASTTTYSSTDEVPNGNGYTTGGNTLTGATITLDGTTAIVDFADTTWAAATITARGALVYNSSKADRAIAVLDFGSDKSTVASAFTVQMPLATATTAIIRIV